MLQTVKRLAQVGDDGLLKIEIPVGMTNIGIEYVIVWQHVAVDDKGWPIGFIDRTYGSMADDPMDEIEQLHPEERDKIE